MMYQHLYAEPDLGPLPAAERQVLLRALAKDPLERFPSCTAMVLALMQAQPDTLPKEVPALVPASASPTAKPAGGPSGTDVALEAANTLVPREGLIHTAVDLRPRRLLTRMAARTQAPGRRRLAAADPGGRPGLCRQRLVLWASGDVTAAGRRPEGSAGRRWRKDPPAPQPIADTRSDRVAQRFNPHHSRLPATRFPRQRSAKRFDPRPQVDPPAPQPIVRNQASVSPEPKPIPPAPPPPPGSRAHPSDQGGHPRRGPGRHPGSPGPAGKLPRAGSPGDRRLARRGRSPATSSWPTGKKRAAWSCGRRRTRRKERRRPRSGRAGDDSPRTDHPGDGARDAAPAHERSPAGGHRARAGALLHGTFRETEDLGPDRVGRGRSPRGHQGGRHSAHPDSAWARQWLPRPYRDPGCGAGCTHARRQGDRRWRARRQRAAPDRGAVPAPRRSSLPRTMWRSGWRRGIRWPT